MLTGFGFRVPQLVQIMQGGLNSFVSALVHFIHSKKKKKLLVYIVTALLVNFLVKFL